MRIKDEIFCFAHFRWCHNGWASNILSGGCRRPPRLKYCKFHQYFNRGGYRLRRHPPLKILDHYDTIESGQNKKSHLLFSKNRLAIRY